MVSSRRGLLGRYAGFVTRGAALVIDIVIVSVAVILTNWVIALPITYFFNFDIRTCTQDPTSYGQYVQLICRSVGLVWFVVTIITAPLYFSLLVSASGQTIGKYLMGIRIVRVDGQRMTLGLSFVRFLGYFVSALPLMTGFLVVLVDPRRRALHDRLAGTCVIYTWHARQNDFLLDRVYHWFHKGEDHLPTRPLPKLSSAYDIVAIALPNYNRMRITLDTVQSAVDRGDIAVTNTAVLAKDRYGDIGIVGVSDLVPGDDNLAMIDASLDLSSPQLKHIDGDMPSDSFIILVLLKDEYVDTLTGQISRRSAAQVRVYDVGDNSDTLTAQDGTSKEKAAGSAEAAPAPSSP